VIEISEISNHTHREAFESPLTGVLTVEYLCDSHPDLSILLEEALKYVNIKLAALTEK
jgi:hypothetical protein